MNLYIENEYEKTVVDLFLCIPLVTNAQTEEKPYYIYNIVYINVGLTKVGFTVDIDNGQTTERLKDKDGKTIKFKTPAAVLNYLYSLGWEIYVNGNYKSHLESNEYYWIMRKPCTKEEFEKTLEEGIKK